MTINGLILLSQDPGLRNRLEAEALDIQGFGIRTVSDAHHLEAALQKLNSELVIVDPGNPTSNEDKVVLNAIAVAKRHGAHVLVMTPYKNSTFQTLAGTESIARNTKLSRIIREACVSQRFELEIWGARGTLPVSGRNTLKYGGSTSCVSLLMGKECRFVFDAGTGLRNLSQYLMKRNKGHFDGRIFITHPHWDHLNCIPFFEPFYVPGNRIHLMGPGHESSSFRELLEGQMNGIYFPIKPDRFRADVTFTDMIEGTHCYDGIVVKALRLDHPGYCLGYRVEFGGRSIAYITDNELPDDPVNPAAWDLLVEFLGNVDVLIHDASYFDEQYASKINWGHSSVSRVVDLALASGAQSLLLFHHDPEHDDADIDAKLAEARHQILLRGGRLECNNAREGDRWDIAGACRKGRLR